MSGDAMRSIIPAYLGWGNPERDTVQMRLYATDKGHSPRWDKDFPGGRVAEYACVENDGGEGDRYLVVRLGNRFFPDDLKEEAERQISIVVAALQTTAALRS